MPPKVDPTEVKVVVIKVIGGEVGSAASLAPKVGPLGLSPKKIGDDIKVATEDWKGIKVMVQLTIQNRVAQIEVMPSASALLIRALGEPPRDRKKVKHVKHDGSLQWPQILEAAKIMRPRSCAKEFRGTVKEIVGTAVSINCLIEDKSPKEVLKMIDNDELNCDEP